MRIGLTGGGATVDKVVHQAKQAEADGFTSLWYASVVTGDPLVAIAIAGRETTRIELGTAVLQTYPCHPLLQANRAASVVDAMGRPGFTLGIGPSHEPLIEACSASPTTIRGATPRSTSASSPACCAATTVDFDGDDWTAHTAGRAVRTGTSRSRARLRARPAIAPRRGRARRRHRAVDGTARRDRAPHRAEDLRRRGRGRPPRAAHRRRVSPSRCTTTKPKPASPPPPTPPCTPAWRTTSASSRSADASTPADAAIVGNEAAVRAQLQSLLDAGATDIWAAVFPVGDDRAASRRRTTDLLKELVS